MKDILRRRSEFVASVLSTFITVPKCFCFTREILNTERSSVAEHTVSSDEGYSIHEMHISSKCFSSFEEICCTIAHEAMHASLSDALLALKLQGTISSDVEEFISEKAATCCEDIISSLIKNEAKTRIDFEKVKEQ
jgi:hypothetical protein